MCQPETSKSSEISKEKENEIRTANDCRKAPGGELLMIGFDYVSRKTLKTKFYDSVKEHVNEIRTNVEHYTDFNRAMLQFEEEEEMKFIDEYIQVVKVERFKELTATIESKFKYRIKITKKVNEISAAIKDGCLWSFNLRSLFTKCFHLGKIIEFEKGSIVAYIFSSLKHFDLEGHFELKFCQNRLPFLVQYKALNYIKSHQIFDILINNSKYNEIIKNKKPKSQRQNGKQSYESDDSRLNFEQKQAIEYIVKAENLPLPYLLYGPPGTGKTHTLIAAIEKIVNTTTGNVLVCANSNAICDEITERLIGILNSNQMYRMYSQSYQPYKVKSSIEKVSNCYGDAITLPPLDFLYGFRVIICTLCTAGCLTRARRDAKIFQEAHFSHIIIDECASTHEPMSLVPIAGLCTSFGKIHSSIILSGDPKQLDAITKSRVASKMNFQTSFMEQLLMKPLYKRHPKTRNFNQTYITMLIKNYRSHPQLLHVPNKQFYNQKLKAFAPNEVTDWFIDSELLPSKDFPLIFRSVQGACERGDIDGSLMNKDEASVVMDYIEKLLLKENNGKRTIKETDIGVVTPYRSQCQHIIDCCKVTGLPEITVGTAEVFQGKEKPIIIVSTVRSGNGLGFVSNPKRLNVMVTRAKCLLIIVGNPHDLCADENWCQMIKYCVDNGALIQGDREFTLVKKISKQ